MKITRQHYEEKILQVQLYIEANLNGDLSLNKLAEVADYSPYHFHRIFHGIVGENTNDYVRRLRLEKAAMALRYHQRTILEIALDAGYNSHEAFTRAFVNMFGMSPSEFQDLDFPISLTRRTIMQTLNFTPVDVQIQSQPARRMAYIRVVGPYNNEHLGPAFGKICAWAGQHGLMNDTAQSMGVYHDDPEVTDPQKQRADVGITVPESFKTSGEIQVQIIPASRCAVLRHKGHYNMLDQAYRWLFSEWLPNSGHEPASHPPYELYINDASKLPPEEWLTDICIPLNV